MKGYSFSELVKLAESMVPRSGGTMTGNLTAPKFFMSAAQDMAANAAVRKDYLESVLDASGYKTVMINATHTVTPGQYIPITIRNLGAQGGEIGISTASGGGDFPMNCNTFVGKVFAGGWSDKGSWVSGIFNIYSVSERAIAGFSAGAEIAGAFAAYIESRAFPVQIRVPRDAVVEYNGGAVTIGTATFPVRTGPNYVAGTKTVQLIDFNDGSGYYDTLVHRVPKVRSPDGDFTVLHITGPQGNNPSSAVRRDYLLSSLDTKFDKTGGTITGSVVLQGSIEAASYMQIQGASNPMLEIHQPGNSAILIYKPTNTTNIRFGQGNGAGSEHKGYALLGATGFELLTGNIKTAFNNNRSWHNRGHTMLKGGDAVTYDGALWGLVGQKYNLPGVYDLEMFSGVQTTGSASDTGHIFAASDGTNYLKIWVLSNGGQLSSPGGWTINPNGDLYSPRLGGANVVDWAIGNFSAKVHDHTAAAGNLNIVQGQHSVVGSYIFAALNPTQNASTCNPGSTVAGAHLYPAACADWSQNRAWNFQGTWMCMGFADANNDDRWDDRATLWFRVA